MTFIVMVTAMETGEGAVPEAVGPFPDGNWAYRYMERVKGRVFKMEMMPLLSPTLVDPNKGVIFDPKDGIDQ